MTARQKTYGIRALLMTTVVGASMLAPTYAAGPTFRADYKFTGTALTGFTPIGQADWKGLREWECLSVHRCRHPAIDARASPSERYQKT